MPAWMLVSALLMAFFLGSAIFSFYMASASRVIYYFYGPARKRLSYWKRWQEFFTRRSFCDDCETPIKPLNVIPVLGYFFSGRHCKNCHAEIPLIHPIMESLGGLILVYLLIQTQDFILSFLLLFFCGHLIIAIATDWTLFSLDYENTIFAGVFALAILVRKSIIAESWPDDEWFLLTQTIKLAGKSPDAISLVFQLLTGTIWIGPILTALGAFLLTFPLHLAKPEGLGLGDVWLLIPLGLLHGMPYILLPVILGSGWSVIHILFLQKDRNAPAPLGAFMAMGSILAVPVQFWFF
tara:strand:- start:23936 stop:24820 length:885 start_codon:yes stop_codon:yes gene_type:complete